FSADADLCVLLSFPTRRSSDLVGRHGTRRLRRIRYPRKGELRVPPRELAIAQAGVQRELVAGAVRNVQPIVDGVGSAGRNQMHRSEEHTSELQSLTNLVCRLLL